MNMMNMKHRTMDVRDFVYERLRKHSIKEGRSMTSVAEEAVSKLVKKVESDLVSEINSDR